MVNRYETYHNANISGLLPHTKGSYVHYDDYEALRQRVAESENKLNEQSFKLIAMTKRAEKAEARVAELEDECKATRLVQTALREGAEAKLAKAEEVLYTIMDYKPGSVDAGMSPWTASAYFKEHKNG